MCTGVLLTLTLYFQFIKQMRVNNEALQFLEHLNVGVTFRGT